MRPCLPAQTILQSIAVDGRYRGNRRSKGTLLTSLNLRREATTFARRRRRRSRTLLQGGQGGELLLQEVSRVWPHPEQPEDQLEIVLSLLVDDLLFLLTLLDRTKGSLLHDRLVALDRPLRRCPLQSMLHLPYTRLHQSICRGIVVERVRYNLPVLGPLQDFQSDSVDRLRLVVVGVEVIA